MTCPVNDFRVASQKHAFWPLALLAALLVLGGTGQAHAQGHGRSHDPRVSVVVGGYGYYPSPYLYDPWYGDMQWGMFPPYYRRYNVEPESAVRLEVKPSEAEVYVDGYYAGVVDDFNGTFQRLRVPPGEHDIELYLDGYRSLRRKVYLTPDRTFKLKASMERLAAGQPMEPRPISPQAGPGQDTLPPLPERGEPFGRGPVGRPMTPPQAPYSPSGARRAGPAGAYGRLEIRVQPGDAEIVIDGEIWRGPDSPERLVVDVPEGRHTVEIRRTGYRTYVTDVQVRPGEPTPLNVSLRSQSEP